MGPSLGNAGGGGEEGDPCDTKKPAPSWAAKPGPKHRGDFTGHLLPNVFLCFATFSCKVALLWMRGVLRVFAETQNKARSHSIMLAESILLNTNLRQDLPRANPSPHKSLTMKLRRKDMRTVKQSKNTCFLFPTQCLSRKKSPWPFNRLYLAFCKQDQEKSFHIVRNLVLTLSLVKIKHYPRSIFPMEKVNMPQRKKHTPQPPPPC